MGSQNSVRDKDGGRGGERLSKNEQVIEKERWREQNDGERGREPEPES